MDRRAVTSRPLHCCVPVATSCWPKRELYIYAMPNNNIIIIIVHDKVRVLQLLATTTRENKLEGGYKKLQHSQAGGGMVTRCKLKDGNKPTRESERYNRGTSRRVCGKEESRNLLTCFFLLRQAAYWLSMLRLGAVSGKKHK